MGKPAAPDAVLAPAQGNLTQAPIRCVAGPILHSVRPREPIHLIGVNQHQTIEPLKGGGHQVAVAGPSVYVLVTSGPGSPEAKEMPGYRWLVELPRQSCILRWLVPPETGIDDVIKLVQGGGGANTPHVSPPEGMRKR